MNICDNEESGMGLEKNNWANQLECQKCGTRRIVLSFRPFWKKTMLRVFCPKCRKRKTLYLQGKVENWLLEQVSEQIYKCKKCGEPIADPFSIIRTVGSNCIVFSLTCPNGCEVKGSRVIHKMYFSFIQAHHCKLFPEAEVYPIDSIGASKDYLSAGAVMLAIGLGFLTLFLLELAFSEPPTAFHTALLFTFIILAGFVVIAGSIFLGIYFVFNRKKPPPI